MPIKALETIRYNGYSYKPGDLIKGLPEDEKKRLLRLKSAEKIITSDDIEEVVTTVEVDNEVYEELYTALDENYNVEDLKRSAKATGVQFDVKDVKKDVIDAIIKQGKTDHLLEDADEE